MKKLRRYTRSRTMNWGHVQVVAGALGVALSFVTPAAFPKIDPIWYGISAMIAGAITYWLRNLTRKPIEYYDEDK